MKPEKRKDVVNELKQHTKPDGIHVMNVFVDKPFVEILPGKEKIVFDGNQDKFLPCIMIGISTKLKKLYLIVTAAVCHTTALYGYYDCSK